MIDNLINKQTISPRSIPNELSEKYSKSGPRYTSYPTAPQFTSDFDYESIKSKWQTLATSNDAISLYIHIPFCRSRCLYCGCHTIVCDSSDTTEAYIDALFREVDSIVELIGLNKTAAQLALGGGTPTYLKPEVMTSLIARLKERFIFPDDGERSIEVHPETIDSAYLDTLLELGFNRFSFGVQDFNHDIQVAIRRVQSEQGIFDKVNHLRKQGCDAINIDLIYGLPLQTPDTFEKTVETTITLRPSRIALFGYAHVPWVSPHQDELKKYCLPNPAERIELFGLAFDMLLEAGYRHVGMDHFALSDDELTKALETRKMTRNFMGYSTIRGLDLVGLGVSSISSVNTTFTQNEKGVEKYIELAGSPIWIKGLEKTPEDLLRGEVILELMCNFYLDIVAIETRYGINFKEHFAQELGELEHMVGDGLVKLDDTYLAVTNLGRFFVRNISMPFDEYLKTEKPLGRYSKTV